MRLTRIERRQAKVALAASFAVFGFFVTAIPAHTVSTVTLYGTATPSIGIAAGDPANASLTGGTGAGGTYSVNAMDTQNSVETFNFGTLSSGDGTNEVATMPMRIRGNAACHVSWKITSYSANHISYSGTALTGSTSSSSQLSFITLGTKPMTAGKHGNSNFGSYQASFLNGKTINFGNGGVITASVSTTDEEIVSFSKKPSQNGNISSTDNWVEFYPTFSIPTGFQWQPTGTSPSWSAVVSFIIGNGP